MDTLSLADRIDAVLPQTQCERCGYPGCRPYAEALAAGRARLNQCPPGGQDGVRMLADLLGEPEVPLDPLLGTPGVPEVVTIEEEHCIGCTLCIKACPVDAIVGAPKQMHTVLADRCTGCMLCLPPCPVDCISTLPAPFRWDTRRAESARGRFEERQKRRAEEARLREAHLLALSGPRPGTLQQNAASHSVERKRATIEAALERARLARLARPSRPLASD
jgi:electron transport complex protein RnfB